MKERNRYLCNEKLHFEAFKRFIFTLVIQDKVVQMVLETTNFDCKKEESYLKHSTESRILIDDFLTFMKTEQKSEMSLEELNDQILYFDPTYDESTISLGGMLIEKLPKNVFKFNCYRIIVIPLFILQGFIAFMVFSDSNYIKDSKLKEQVYQDMTQPLCHYWINSSHNT